MKVVIILRCIGKMHLAIRSAILSKEKDCLRFLLVKFENWMAVILLKCIENHLTSMIYTYDMHRNVAIKIVCKLQIYMLHEWMLLFNKWLTKLLDNAQDDAKSLSINSMNFNYCYE